MVADEQDGTSSDNEDPWTLPDSRRPVPDLVADRVLELVRAGVIPPGERLPTEPEVARRFGVARSSVRSGLQRLQAQGVVAVERGRGWFVSASGSRDAADLMQERLASRDYDVTEVMEVRIALEQAAAGLAATRASAGQRDDILKLSKIDQATDPEDSAALLAADEAFHGAVVEAAGNDYLKALYEMVTPLVAAWRRNSFTSAHVHDRSALDHMQVAVQIRRQDDVGARLAMTTHLLGLYTGVARSQRAESGSGHRPIAGLSTYLDMENEPTWEDGQESD
ncbi:FadR/GntR family transcriptional regulator [Actinomycetospora sp. TBRC 11914]|uniref:FadR/GntR family transcriptional regulator n=1 Tax=Actinomycetospora sp. TBRC 11914 TaxID=2729387 RepID=UPI00145CE235|nr:FCD domain-containing protein [Actinomycetospora sp. TBRC 11914]NMO92962.1 FadR family transcriptional regulator [Actinomycetospora sp. TBRC 11914]